VFATRDTTADCGCVVDRGVRIEVCDNAGRCCCAALTRQDWDDSTDADPGIDTS
jgi:hypothetical protein